MIIMLILTSIIASSSHRSRSRRLDRSRRRVLNNGRLR